MADEKKKEEKCVVELKVSMHCNACERSVAKAISKFKGVETFATDMPKHKVTITGKINPEKVMKKIRKKTGKKVDIILPEIKEEKKEAIIDADSKPESDLSTFDYWPKDNKLLIMFSDENTNNCSIM